MRTLLARRRRDERAAVAVEFALVFPILALVVLGIIQYGLYFFSLQAGSQAAREAARRAAVGDMPLCTTGSEPFIPYVHDRVGSANFGNSITVKRTYAKSSGNTGASVQVGDLVTVSVTFNTINLGIPIIPVVGDATISTTADTRVENVPTEPESCT